MIDRELLEKEAMAEVCACWYYDLVDTLYETPDDDSWLSLAIRANAVRVVNK